MISLSAFTTKITKSISMWTVTERCFRKDINFKRLHSRLLLIGIGDRSLLLIQYQEKRTLPTGNEICCPLTGKRHLNPVCYLPRNRQYRLLQIQVRSINERLLTCRYFLYIEKKNEDVTLPSRGLGRCLTLRSVSEHVTGAAILDLTSRGPPS